MASLSRPLKSLASALARHRLIALDTSVWIYHFEASAGPGRVASALIEAVASGRVEAVASELVLLELLVAPLRKGMQDSADEIELLLERHPHFTLRPVSRDVLLSAAELRARYNLKTPDSIMLASAMRSGATLAVTNDAAWRRVREVDVVLLADLKP